MGCRGFDDYNDYKRSRRELNKVTEAMCELCKALDEYGWPTFQGALPEALLAEAWWTEHKKLDADRARREEVERERLASVQRVNHRRELARAQRLLLEAGFKVSKT
jgi:hypothetical protein